MFANVEKLGIRQLDLEQADQWVNLESPWGNWAWRKGHNNGAVYFAIREKDGSLGRQWTAIEMYAWRKHCREAGDHHKANWATHILRVVGLEKKRKDRRNP